MSTPSKTDPKKDDAKAASEGMDKQKKQLIVLGSLSVLLVLVLFMQLSDDADLDVAVLEGNVAQAFEGDETSEEPAEDEVVAGVDNPVLSEPSEGETLKRDPFAAFWDNEAPAESEEVITELPVLRLDATMPHPRLPLAVIDGSLHFMGDVIQGWTIDQIGDRSITLRAPSNDTHTVQMPVLSAQISIPVASMIIEVPEKDIEMGAAVGSEEDSAGSNKEGGAGL